jgi:hypothetical protein
MARTSPSGSGQTGGGSPLPWNSKRQTLSASQLLRLGDLDTNLIDCARKHPLPPESAGRWSPKTPGKPPRSVTVASVLFASGPRYRGSNPCLPAKSTPFQHNRLRRPPPSGIGSLRRRFCKRPAKQPKNAKAGASQQTGTRSRRGPMSLGVEPSEKAAGSGLVRGSLQTRRHSHVGFSPGRAMARSGLR